MIKNNQIVLIASSDCYINRGNTPVLFELTQTVTQIANNWKEMNELTLTVTALKRFEQLSLNCNSKDLQLSYS